MIAEALKMAAMKRTTLNSVVHMMKPPSAATRRLQLHRKPSGDWDDFCPKMIP